jgi:hypothetical protein
MMDVTMQDATRKKATTAASFGPKPVILQHRYNTGTGTLRNVFQPNIKRTGVADRDSGSGSGSSILT